MSNLTTGQYIVDYEQEKPYDLADGSYVAAEDVPAIVAAELERLADDMADDGYFVDPVRSRATELHPSTSNDDPGHSATVADRWIANLTAPLAGNIEVRDVGRTARVWAVGDPEPEDSPHIRIRDKDGSVWRYLANGSWHLPGEPACGWPYLTRHYGPVAEVREP